MSTEGNETVVVRTATEDDLPRILEIFRGAFRLEAPSASELAAYREQCPHGMLVAQIEDQIIGTTVVFLRDGRPHLYGTAIVPEFQKAKIARGIGRRIVATQVWNFQKLGYPEMDTMIRADNVLSHSGAEKLGFRHIHTIRNFFYYPRRSGRLYINFLNGKAPVTSLSLKDKVKDLWARKVEPRLNQGLHVIWFDSWYTVLDNALHELPEMEGCPHELFRMVMQNPSSTRKRTALVMEGEEAVALVGLREQGRHWLPAMQGIIPECIAPAREGYLFPALRALGVDVRIADWPTPPPEEARARNVVAVPVFRTDCQGDFERYWRESGYMKSIRLARNRTKGFTFEVDRPGSAALVVANWEEKWRDHPEQQTVIAADLTVAADYFEERGQHHSFLLLDGDVPAAGVNCFVHGNDLVATVMFRDKRYDWNYVGTRLLGDLIVQWAAEHGFAKLDIGGWYPYKAKWAPQDGERWDFRFCPLRQHLREQVIWKARAVPAKLMALFRRLPVPSDSRGDRDDQGVDLEQPQEAPK